MKLRRALPAILQDKIGGELIQTTNGRDLDAWLENGDEFTHWIDDRIGQYGFKQDIHFINDLEITQTMTKDRYPRGSKRKVYHLTLEMAKHLSMVERNEKGREARRYFLDCERKVKEAPAAPASALDPNVAALHASLALEAKMRRQGMANLNSIVFETQKALRGQQDWTDRNVKNLTEADAFLQAQIDELKRKSEQPEQKSKPAQSRRTYAKVTRAAS